MNAIQLIGRLTKDPAVTETKGDSKLATLRLAVPRPDKDQDPVYVDVVAFNAQGEAVAEHLAKGREVAVAGRLDYQEWSDDTGAKHRLSKLEAIRCLKRYVARELYPFLATHAP